MLSNMTNNMRPPIQLTVYEQFERIPDELYDSKYMIPYRVNSRMYNKRCLQVESLDDSIALDVTGSKYADIIKFDYIVQAECPYEGILIAQNTYALERVRKLENEDSIGILYLYIHANTLVIIIDKDREYTLTYQQTAL